MTQKKTIQQRQNDRERVNQLFPDVPFSEFQNKRVQHLLSPLLDALDELGEE